MTLIEKSIFLLKKIYTRFFLVFICEISESFNLDKPPFELRPAIVLFNGDGTIKWKKIGRSYQYFSDQAIEDYLDCDNWI